MDWDDFKKPSMVIAAGIFIACSLWGLGKLLQFVIPAICAGAGLAYATAMTGFATAGVISTWMPQAAVVALVAGGGGAAVIASNVFVKIVKKDPYSITLPLLSLIAIFFVDMTKDSLLLTDIERAFYALCTGLCVVCGGALLTFKRVQVRIVGGVLPFLPVALVVVTFARDSKFDTLLGKVASSGYAGLVGLGGAILLAVLTIILGLSLSERNGR